MSAQKPLISFIVTVYNLEKYIGNCLDSILSQNFDNYEIVLVDNASTDTSPKICQQYAYKYPNKIKYFQVPKEIAVMGTAHYFGFGLAQGEYIQFIDGDDRLAENIVPEIADTIITKRPDFVMGRYECYLEDSSENGNNFLDAAFEADKINNVSYDDAMVYLSTLPNFHGVFWRYIFKKTLFAKTYKEVGDLFFYPFTSTLYSDGIMLLKLFLRANSVIFLDKVIYIYTRRANGSGVGFLDGPTLSRDSIISFLSALHFLISLKPKGGKHTYLINKIYYIFQFYKTGLTYVNDEMYAQIAQILEENIELLEGIQACGIEDMQIFYNCIREYGCEEGVKAYTKKQNDPFLNRLNKYNCENLYIIPSGNKTMSTLSLLNQNGYKVSAIFDNDPKKHGLTYQGVPCHSPGEILSWSNAKKASATFILSAMDESLVEILTNQLKEYGIAQEQMIIKE